MISAALEEAQDNVDSAVEDAPEGTRALLETVDSRTTAYEQAIAAAGDATDNQDAELAAFETANGDATATATADALTLDGVADAVAELNDNGQWELTDAGETADLGRTDQMLSALQTSTDATEAQGDALESLQDAVQSVVRAEQDDSELEIDWDDADSLISDADGDVSVDFSTTGVEYTADADGDAGTIADAAAEEANDLQVALDAQSGLQDSVEDFQNARDLDGELQQYNDATEDAELALTNEEDDDPSGLGVSLLEGDSSFTADDDVYLFNEEASADASLDNFGDSGDDRIFIGDSFSRVDLDDDAVFTDAQGDADTLEVFFQQNGDDAVLNFEGEAFAGSGSSNADLSEVTLTGVNTDDLSIESGFINVA